MGEHSGRPFPHFDSMGLSGGDADRMEECWNALAGIDDPEGFMRDVRAVLRECARPAIALTFAESAENARRARALLAKLPGGA